ncbi:MAG: hypothetical protein QOK13_1632 [Gaiellaceae bacterium]|jgi:hypothetical protein|nr:hypothetical protein [Gaiellaceae bacterium]MDX6517774.1 hypothetical protein [Gaiellaceae bacterium]
MRAVDASIAWAEADDDAENDVPEDAEAADADVEDIAARRLRRWLRGMFGGAADEPKG